MNRRSFLRGTLAAGAAARRPAAAQDKRRPNIVVLVAGGWRGQDANTPNLKRLEREGASLSRTYTTNPERDPARATLLTGRYPHAANVVRNGIPLPVGEKTLAGLLAASGYSAKLFGAWNTKAENLEAAQGFLTTERAEPFFAGLVWQIGGDARTGAAAKRLRVRTPGAGRHNPARYYAECARLDAEVGRVLDALEERARDTLVVFTSDRGEMLGAHGLWGDGQPFEEAARVPLLIRYPARIRPRRTLTAPVSTVDLVPTLLTLASAPHPDNLQGRDLSAWLTGDESPDYESVFGQGRLGTEEEWRMLVRGFDKIVVDRDLQVSHLYHLRQDPRELENLATDKDQRTKRDEMRAVLLNRMSRISDRILPSGLKLRDY